MYAMVLLAACAGGDDKSDPAAGDDSGAPVGDSASTIAPCDAGPRAAIHLDVPEVDFGYVALGASSTHTVTVSNTGDAALGLDAIRTADTTEYTVAWDLAGTTCAREEVVDGETVTVLEAGCSLPLAVTYTPATAGGIQGALVVEDTVGGTDFESDPLHAREVVWLAGTTDGDLDVDAVYAAGRVIRAEQTAILAGETTELEVRVGNAPTVTTTWTAEAGTVSAPSSLQTPFTGDTDVGVGENENLYVVLLGLTGNEDWAFTSIAVWPPDAELYPCAR